MGGAILNKWGPQNITWPKDPSALNRITHIINNGGLHSFRLADGSECKLGLANDVFTTTMRTWELPTANLSKIELLYKSEANTLFGISVFDRSGRHLFKTNDDEIVDKKHTILLSEQDLLVGFRSRAF